MKNILLFFLGTFILFMATKIKTKGYMPLIINYFKSSNNSANSKKNSTTLNYTQASNNQTSNKSLIDYSYFYYNQNITCKSLGIHTWAVLHSIAASYPNKPNETEKDNFSKFFNGLINLYPTKNSFIKNILKEHPMENNSREELVYYICEIHNLMNKELGKEKFNCRKAFDIWGGDCGC